MRALVGRARLEKQPRVVKTVAQLVEKGGPEVAMLIALRNPPSRPHPNVQPDGKIPAA